MASSNPATAASSFLAHRASPERFTRPIVIIRNK
jgi:hypothetical protein